ncbi:MAG: hypothetical protein U5K55_03490 [Aliarcobacter sp.]|nr:hypothetical protein [Aliarcobacter sp.]
MYKPYQGGIIPLWEIEITNNHWSIRDNPIYDKSKKSIKPKE